LLFLETHPALPLATSLTRVPFYSLAVYEWLADGFDALVEAVVRSLVF